MTTDKVKSEPPNKSAGIPINIWLQLVLALVAVVAAFSVVKSQANENTRNITKVDKELEKEADNNADAHLQIRERSREIENLVLEYKGDIKSLASIMNEVKYEVRENRAEMKRWEFEREGIKNAE